jgi:hypothetical protein
MTMSDDYQQEVLEPVKQMAAAGGDLREDVRRLVVAALIERQADPKAIRQVMKATVGGLGEGLSEHAESAGRSLKTAITGLDEALGKGLYAMKLALDESWQTGKRFTDEDLRTAYEAVKGLEDDMVGTLKVTGEKSKGMLKEEFASLRDHLSRGGSDTGTQAREVLATLTRQMADVAGGVAKDTQASLHDARQRLSAVASGILRGLADSLDQRNT